jgi:hypothetical protein
MSGEIALDDSLRGSEVLRPLPLSDHRKISWLTELADTEINLATIPTAVSVEVQEPFSRGGTEYADLAPACASPIAGDGQIP